MVYGGEFTHWFDGSFWRCSFFLRLCGPLLRILQTLGWLPMLYKLRKNDWILSTCWIHYHSNASILGRRISYFYRQRAKWRVVFFFLTWNSVKNALASHVCPRSIPVWHQTRSYLSFGPRRYENDSSFCCIPSSSLLQMLCLFCSEMFA